MRVPAAVPGLATEDLLLRGFDGDDVAELVRIADDRRIADAVLSLPHPYTARHAETWIAGQPTMLAAGERIEWAITRGTDGALLGAIGLALDLTHDRADLGYWIAPAFQGRGHASAAARAVVDYAFGPLEVHRVTAHHMAWNVASGRVLEKAGLRPEGVMRDHIRKSARFVDAVFYGAVVGER